MASLTARALAAAGHAVLQMDLKGCGDSSGDFADATWDDWLADVRQGAAWLRARHDQPLWLWGLRAGCLLNVEAARQMREPVRHVFWQPPGSGKALLQQFLRLKLASGLTAAKVDVARSPRAPLDGGEPVHIAGYTLQPGLAQGLGGADLQPPSAPTCSVWLETSTVDQPALRPATQDAIARWREAGHWVHAEVVRAPSFWQTQEIEDAPALVEATVRALQAAQEQAAERATTA
jgi:exosortase A-associated hydrolase 2